MVNVNEIEKGVFGLVCTQQNDYMYENICICKATELKLKELILSPNFFLNKLFFSLLIIYTHTSTHPYCSSTSPLNTTTQNTTHTISHTATTTQNDHTTIHFSPDHAPPSIHMETFLCTDLNKLYDRLIIRV